jgi:hypothetical protein
MNFEGKFDGTTECVSCLVPIETSAQHCSHEGAAVIDESDLMAFFLW